MKDRIFNAFRYVKERHSFIEIDGLKLYVVDRAESKPDGDVEISNEEPDIKPVCLENNSNVTVFFDGFKKNALPLTRKTYSKQCECAICPSRADKEEWILFIETKYAADIERARKKEADYPNKMVRQIKDTVKYFRDKGILASDKTVHAIISFPNLENFNSWVFPIDYADRTQEGIEDILLNDRIIIRATSSAKIVNENRIIL